MRRQVSDLATKARRPAPKPATLPPGTVTLPPELGEHLRRGYVWANHLAVIALLRFQFESGVAWGHASHFEGSGDDLVLHLDSVVGLPIGRAIGEDGVLMNWKQLFVELEERRWFLVERNGKDWKIRRGPKALGRPS